MNTVIYYPFLSPSPDWLRVAALCWDKVYRIKPRRFAPTDSEDIQQLDQAFGGFLESIDPSDMVPRYISHNPKYHDDNTLEKYIKSMEEFRIELLRKFEIWVESRAERLKAEALSLEEGVNINVSLLSGKFPDTGILEILAKHGLSKVNYKPIEGTKRTLLKWEFEEELENCNEMPTYLLRLERRNKPTRPISPDHKKYLKLRKRADWLKANGFREYSSALIQEYVEIRDRNKITAPRYSYELYVPPDVGFHYLSLLATKYATDLNSDMVADSEDYTSALFHDIRSVRGEVITSVLQAYLPEGFYNLSPSRIAEFRSEFSTQRLKYEKEVQSVVREFSDLASEGELQKVKDRITAIAIERVEETKQTYRRAKLDMIVKTFSVSIAPAALAASISSALGIGIFAPAGITAALSSIAATKLLEWEKARADRIKSPWSYVLDSAQILK